MRRIVLLMFLLVGCSHELPAYESHYTPPPTPTVKTFVDDFTQKPDGPLVGQYSVLGQIPWRIEGGRLTHTPTDPDVTQSSYLGVNLPGKVLRLWVEYETPGPPQESVALIVSGSEFTVPGYEFADAGAHCTFTDTTFRYDSVRALRPGLETNVLARGTYPTLTPGVYRAEIRLSGNQAAIVTPDGKTFRTRPNPTVADWSGSWATLQLYAQGDGQTRNPLQILRWGADYQ